MSNNDPTHHDQQDVWFSPQISGMEHLLPSSDNSGSFRYFEQSGLNMVVYGPPGSGKTLLALQCAVAAYLTDGMYVIYLTKDTPGAVLRKRVKEEFASFGIGDSATIEPILAREFADALNGKNLEPLGEWYPQYSAMASGHQLALIGLPRRRKGYPRGHQPPHAFDQHPQTRPRLHESVVWPVVTQQRSRHWCCASSL